MVFLGVLVYFAYSTPTQTPSTQSPVQSPTQSPVQSPTQSPAPTILPTISAPQTPPTDVPVTSVLTPPVTAPPHDLQMDVYLNQGENLINGPLMLSMQGDGNLVLYKNGTPTWASGSVGKGVGPYRLLMQSDGNLVVYGSTEIGRASCRERV